MSGPSLEETLKLARSLTHSGFTQSKADLVVAGIEQAIADNEERHAGQSMHVVAQRLGANAVAADEIDEDPPSVSTEAILDGLDDSATYEQRAVALDEVAKI